MRRIEPFGLVMLALVAMGCAHGREAGRQAGYDSAEAQGYTATKSPEANRGGASGEADASAVLASSGTSAIQQRAVIRQAQIAVRVDDVHRAEKAANRILSQAGGYTDSATSSSLDSKMPTLTMVARVPAARFDAAVSSFESLGTRLSKSIRAEDVTEQLVDMGARLKTMYAQEEAYRAMLRQARSLQTTIQLQNELTSLRGTIESIEAQRKSLAGQASLSTIEVTFTQRAVAGAKPSDPNWMAQAWGEASSSVSGAFRGFAVFAMWLVAYAPFWSVAGLAVWSVRRSLRQPPPEAGPQV
jgi:hypothetical protein